ncbi:helix-turn-helix domain-containing protein [Paractinoplanes hotanensis]|uniref:Helix-turn-helix transcriptional regulator n=1 Tax=Paractinoplanes hotanensis TaxID=2906497 RepID=A0ABT0Y6L6_9ACTN|nr:helix-turn-helix transcriptional regulator [Actinoplanes hotanensis]MCM4081122.1 helix-turn-helix transcriptional regulator [Actinoplanes hotanensis]
MLGLLATGLTDESVAARLGVSERTVRRTMAAVMARLGARSRFQAGLIAARQGLTPPATVCGCAGADHRGRRQSAAGAGRGVAGSGLRG